ncbi:MAG: glycosyltransferase family 9 protein, partial [Chloroflexi bacterium]|nr:glycosyltransferase family 9 protein [Chloroflexota bacterium]
ASIPTVGYGVPESLPFLSQTVPYTPGLHERDQSLRLVAATAGHVNPTAVGAIRLFADASPPASLPDGAIAIHAGAGAEVKRWTEEGWRALTERLMARYPVVLTAGDPVEEEEARRLSAGLAPGVTVAPRMSLPELAAFYRRCRLVAGPDNGPLHVARAVGTPTVALFGPTDPKQFGPTPQDGDIHQVIRLPWPCLPCRRLDYTPTELTYHLCVKRIEPDLVLAAIDRGLIAGATRTP